MTDIIERAARAVAAIDYRKGVRDCARPADPPVFTPVPWDDLPAKAQLGSMEKARAVLRAIRKPSEGMVRDACARKFEVSADGYSHHGGLYPDSATETWQTMIDAALGEE